MSTLEELKKDIRFAWGNRSGHADFHAGDFLRFSGIDNNDVRFTWATIVDLMYDDALFERWIVAYRLGIRHPRKELKRK